MTQLLAFFTALALSVAIIPIMIRLAPRLGMVDQPDPRKVHVVPIPRVGGVGIVIGMLVPLFLWLPLDAGAQSFLFGSLVLLAFGIWDDCQELGHYVKFIGQFIAVIAVVYYGDVYVINLPLLDGPLADSYGRIFTVFAMVGMINAINHADGLDGLAGGLSVLSLSCIAYLAWMAGSGDNVITIAAATMGGIFGFLRYNSHPARVFMGDGGSQVLGFALAFLAVVLTQMINTALSPALPALFLGLPIVDILAVFAQRIYGGMNWFRATKNHIHHRLLELGFDHYEAVVIIYSIQVLFILSALLLSYESDALILSIYVGVCAAVFVLLLAGERSGWRAHKPQTTSPLTKFVLGIRQHILYTQGPTWVIAITLPALFIAVSVFAGHVPRDFGIGAAILAIGLIISLLAPRARGELVPRAVTYVTAAFVVYLETRHTGAGITWFPTAQMIYFAVLALAIMVAVRQAANGEFITTPTDYLIILVVIVTGVVAHARPDLAHLGPMAVKLVILFYACELLLGQMRQRWNPLIVTTLGALAVLGVRGLL